MSVHMDMKLQYVHRCPQHSVLLYVIYSRMSNPAGFLLWGLKHSTVNVLFYCWVFTGFTFLSNTGFLSGVTGFNILARSSLTRKLPPGSAPQLAINRTFLFFATQRGSAGGAHCPRYSVFWVLDSVQHSLWQWPVISPCSNGSCTARFIC